MLLLSVTLFACKLLLSFWNFLDEDEDESDEDEEEEESQKDPKLHAVVIPHQGGINRIRVSFLFFIF